MSNRNDTGKKYNHLLIDDIKDTNEQYTALKQIHEKLNPNLKTTVKIGAVSVKIQKLLGLYLNKGEPVFISKSNYEHILDKHPDEFIRFSSKIDKILNYPDYVGYNNHSIEYIKEFKVENKFIKVAVRVSGFGKYFVRTMYYVPEYKVRKLIKIGRLKKVD